MFNGDPAIPLAASVIMQPVTDRQKRLALTAAAAILPNPLGLAPAIIARQQVKAQPDAGAGTGGDREAIRPRLATVPRVVGSKEIDAVGLIKKEGLVPVVERHESSEEERGLVITQSVEAGARVPVKKRIVLSIGHGPAKPAAGDDMAAFVREARAFFDQTNTKLETLTRDIEDLKQSRNMVDPNQRSKQAK